MLLRTFLPKGQHKIALSVKFVQATLVLNADLHFMNRFLREKGRERERERDGIGSQSVCEALTKSGVIKHKKTL